jgi:hypothetical protein
VFIAAGKSRKTRVVRRKTYVIGRAISGAVRGAAPD